MKDKRIIDVCPYQGECSVSGCKRNDDGCFVRQLFEERYRAENQIVELNKTIKAKEQECESWKTLIDQAQIEQRKLEQQLEAYKMEAEEGKEINAELKATNEDLLSIQYKLADNNQRLRQTLTEIKEIAEKAEEQCAIPENYFKRNNVSWKQHQLKGLTCKFKQILQKISECEVK